MLKITEPKKVLCIHDLSGVGRCSLAVILPVLSVMGIQPVALPTVVLSTHTGGFGTPARLDGCAYGEAALEHYRELGLSFDCIYTGYLGGEEQAALAEKATEAGLLLEKELPAQLDEEGARALADELAASLTPNVVVTGLQLDKYIACAGAGRDRFVVKKLHIARSFPGTGDLYGAVLIGSLIQGNALSAAADNAAEFVALAIQKTPCDQDTRFGVWFEPLLPRLCPMQEE